jgi:cell division transport system permease protein
VTPAQQQAVEDVLDRNPEVSTWYEESKEEAFEKVKELFGAERFEGRNAAATADDMAVSLWITLKDPDEFEGVTSEVSTMPGVSSVRDQRATVGPILRGISVMQIGALATAVALVIAALLLVANTIRLAALARRKEIGIMRLVGASTLYIALPFLLEALVTALFGMVLAGGALAAAMWFGVHRRLEDYIGWIPWVGMQEFLYALAVVGILGPVLTLLPTLVLTRKYLKV